MNTRKTLIDSLECRRLLSTVVLDSQGKPMGYTDEYIPPGGIHVATEAEMRRGRASGDGEPGFQITVVFNGGLTATQQAAFNTAAARWQTILLGDLPDVGSIDDVRITASGIAIDGVGNILGQAGPTGTRNAANKFIPYQGVMQFDTADLASLEAQGTLVSTIAHEMGHVLGVGTIWSQNAVLTGSGTSNPLFTGAAARAEYSKMNGVMTPQDVPVENTGGQGTANSHWRETTFASELMTGFLSGNSQPLSRLTAASMIDLGYPMVDLEAADLFTRPTNPLPTIGTLSAPSEVLINASLALTLSNATDVSLIQFFRESNGIPGLQATGNITSDTLVSTISSGLSTNVATTGLLAGNYTFYAVVKDAFGLQSAFRSVSVNLTDAVAAPSTPALSAESDTGTSNSDRITSDNTPTFSGVGPFNQTIQLFNGQSLLGTTTSDALGNWTFTAPVLADGVYNIYARASDGVNLSNPSGTVTVTIDTVAPVIVSALYDREMTQDVSITLEEALATQITAGKLTLTNTTAGSPVGIGSVTYSGGNTVAKISFSALFLPNGRYQLTLAGSGLSDVAGNFSAALDVQFTQVAGDATNDGIVNFDDLLVIAQNYNNNGRTFSQGNFNYDASGLVDFSDLLILAQNYGISVVQAPVKLQVSRTKSRSAAVVELSSAT